MKYISICILDIGSNQIVVAVVCVLVSSLVTLVVSLIAFRMWYRKQISKSTVTVDEKQMSSIYSAASRDNVGYVNEQMSVNEMSSVDRQTGIKDTTEYQQLGEREISKTPDSYQTIRVQ